MLYGLHAHGSSDSQAMDALPSLTLVSIRRVLVCRRCLLVDRIFILKHTHTKTGSEDPEVSTFKWWTCTLQKGPWCFWVSSP